jgi:hypothetical protein
MRRPVTHLGCAATLPAVALAARPGVTSAVSDQSATPFKSRTNLGALTVTVVTRPELRTRTRSGYSDGSGRGAQASVR